MVPPLFGPVSVIVDNEFRLAGWQPNVAWATGANPGSGAGWNIGNIPEAFDLSESLDEAGLRINVIQSYGHTYERDHDTTYLHL